MACDRVQFSKKSHGDNGSLPPCWNRKKPELQSQAHKHKQCQVGIFAKYRANLAPGKTFAREESGTGNMKAAFQCVGWKKKGSCFHELRRSRYPQEVQRAVRAGGKRAEAARGRSRSHKRRRVCEVFC